MNPKFILSLDTRDAEKCLKKIKRKVFILKIKLTIIKRIELWKRKHLNKSTGDNAQP